MSLFSLKIIGLTAALIGVLSIFIGSSLIPITLPFSRSVYDNTFIADPLVLCDVKDELCSNLFKNRRWGGRGGVVENERVLMIATVNNDSNSIYQFVKTLDENYNIPVFNLNIICNGSISFNGKESKESKLEDRWLVEFITIELDEQYYEITRITVNFVKILTSNSSCDENAITMPVRDYMLCRPIMDQPIVFYMNTHVEYTC
ncbi:6269_t:CDS:2 [Gigaspora margarita]|uniref:6269_t:CDS:1 n=1 Tax=Gigaspora margarita TaxID=4874 RepID=A0ABN7UMK8_GIGMA|nr:6269_t:CDS:2 [Gigaspora margarita]